MRECECEGRQPDCCRNRKIRYYLRSNRKQIPRKSVIPAKAHARESPRPRTSPVDGLIEAIRDFAVRDRQETAPAVAIRLPQRRPVSHAG